ncbi:hypothetical protein CUC01_01195 [Akkermansia muciniphila]|nr:hypothetical protein CUB96_09870 [Akkermansia muciniphila]AYR33714.1 hypothetical protein CUC01_01195 [Akkermansia muciniphila]QBH17966.1 hypothetical protein EYB66_04750 [Akkermansia muciniphila]QEE55491.1 hypothetical protein FU653_05695 [Akkermansia muciniphila]HBW69552.1 hypothetical protein [Akkermansia muciniphila]
MFLPCGGCRRAFLYLPGLFSAV